VQVQQRLATIASVPTSDVHVTLTPASVLVEATIDTAPHVTDGAAEAVRISVSLRAAFGTATAASDQLGMAVESTAAVSTASRTLVHTASPPPVPPQLPHESGSTRSTDWGLGARSSDAALVAVVAGISVAVLAAMLLVQMVHRRRRMRTSTVLKPDDDEVRVERCLSHLTQSPVCERVAALRAIPTIHPFGAARLSAHTCPARVPLVPAVRIHAWRGAQAMAIGLVEQDPPITEPNKGDEHLDTIVALMNLPDTHGTPHGRRSSWRGHHLPIRSAEGVFVASWLAPPGEDGAAHALPDDPFDAGGWQADAGPGATAARAPPLLPASSSSVIRPNRAAPILQKYDEASASCSDRPAVTPAVTQHELSKGAPAASSARRASHRTAPVYDAVLAANSHAAAGGAAGREVFDRRRFLQQCHGSASHIATPSERHRRQGGQV
jgi:hypothetical protein